MANAQISLAEAISKDHIVQQYSMEPSKNNNDINVIERDAAAAPAVAAAHDIDPSGILVIEADASVWLKVV